MRFVSLQSGSAGNCFLVQTKDKNILIDVGIDLTKITKRLSFLGISMENIDTVFITHEHSDHIKSIKYIDSSLIYATKETLPFIKNYNYVYPFKMFQIGETCVFPIPMSHDVANGVGYLIHDGKESLLYLTDTGYVKKDIIPLICNCNHYIIEANHNVDMVKSSKRPYFLKQRILSRKGHLSNTQCGQILAKIIGDKTKTIMLAHISGECNTHDICLNEVQSILRDSDIDFSNIEMVVASRNGITFGRKEYENAYTVSK